MDKTKVEDLMIPLTALYAVQEDGSFADAVHGLELALVDFKAGKRPLAVLIVLDAQGNLVGKISPSDILRSMEPSYAKVLNEDISVQVSKFGYLIQSLREQVQHASLPWDKMCQTARTCKVSDIMQKPAHSQVVQVGESLNEAIHRFVLGKHNTLFVTNGRQFLGVLNMRVIYLAIIERLKTECQL